MKRLWFIGGITLLLAIFLLAGKEDAEPELPVPQKASASIDVSGAARHPRARAWQDGPRLLTPDSAALDPFDPYVYADPATAGSVPLLFVKGLEDEFLSPHFRVNDFIGRDGAPYARISPDLIRTLELLLWLADAPIYVNSAYRHPTHNADPLVGGVPNSQHLAGLAADVWSPELTPGELAEIALDVTECKIGIGLGRTFLHVDLRGYTASWVQPGAAMDEAIFDAWVSDRCATLEERNDALPGFAQAESAAEKQASQAAAAREQDLIATYRGVMSAFADVQYQRYGPGAVILDMRRDSALAEADLPYRLSYALLGSADAQTWDLDALIGSVPAASAFAFVLIQPDSTATVSVTSHADARR